MKLNRRLLAALALGLAVTAAHGQSTWTVKPEWVRAHEEFLASDALAGRGSATHEEQITAAYVGSRFLAYGLKPAPGMSGFLQAAEVVAPVLDGHAELHAANLSLQEGVAFDLLVSGGGPASGPLRRVDAGALAKATNLKGAVVLVTGGSKGMAAYGAVRRTGAAMLLVEASDATRGMSVQMGGKTRVPMRLKESEPRTSTAVAALSSAALGQLAALPEGTPVDLAVHPVPQDHPRQTFNAIGFLEGSDPSGGTILLTAHLDHLGVGRPVDGDAIYNGADDDAAGTTAVLELAHALAAGPKLRRNVLFVCYGSEEAGGLGSNFFGAHPPVPLPGIVTNLEFEMIGNQDPKMPKGVLLLTGWERSNLGPTLKQHGALLGPDPYPEQHFFERSDNYSLALRGVVAHTAAGWGTVPTYHQPSDDLAHLDIGFMTAAIQSLVEPMRWLASSDFRPAWNPGGQPAR